MRDRPAATATDDAPEWGERMRDEFGENPARWLDADLTASGEGETCQLDIVRVGNLAEMSENEAVAEAATELFEILSKVEEVRAVNRARAGDSNHAGGQ